MEFQINLSGKENKHEKENLRGSDEPHKTLLDDCNDHQLFM